MPQLNWRALWSRVLHLNGLARWLLILPLVLVLLLMTGQLALALARSPGGADTQSHLNVDYLPWPLDLSFQPVNPAILTEVFRDQQREAEASGTAFLPGQGQQIAALLFTPTPSAPPGANGGQPSASPTLAGSGVLMSPTPTLSLPPTPTASATVLPTPTLSATPAASPTNVPPGSTATFTPSPSATATASPSPTATSTARATSTSTSTATPTDTPTVTATSTASATPTDTATPTATATATATNTAVPGFNEGPPDGSVADIPIGTAMIVDLGGTAITSHAGSDFIYYENRVIGCCGGGDGILMDWVIVEVSADGTTWSQVFYWGNSTGADTNTTLWSNGYYGTYGAAETDNEPIPAAYLLGPYTSGIGIDVDFLGALPPGGYRYVRITSLAGPGGDASQLDAIEVLP